MKILKFFLTLTILAFSVGCQLLPENAQLKSYRVLVQQGNVIEENKVDSLKIDMSKEQVIFLLGEPVLNNIFNKNRWDYVYYRKRDPEKTQLNMISIFFKEDNIVNMKRIVKNDDGLFEVNGNDNSNKPEFIYDDEIIALKEEVFEDIELEGSINNKVNIENSSNEKQSDDKKLKSDEKNNKKLESAKINKKSDKEKLNNIYVEPKKRRSDNQIVKDIIINWANAWQNKNLDEYFTFYSDEFTSNYFDDHELWKKDRTKRITSKSNIKIEVNDFSVTFEIEKNEIAIAKFQQSYISDSYNDTVIKKLTLIKNKNEWEIISEDIIDGKY